MDCENVWINLFNVWSVKVVISYAVWVLYKESFRYGYHQFRIEYPMYSTGFFICLHCFQVAHLICGLVFSYLYLVRVFSRHLISNFAKMLKRAKSSFAIQKPISIKSKNFIPMCQNAFNHNLVTYRNESTLKKRWVRNLLTSVLLGFGGGFSIVLSHYIRYRIRWYLSIIINLSIHIHTHSAVRAFQQVSSDEAQN